MNQVLTLIQDKIKIMPLVAIKYQKPIQVVSMLLIYYKLFQDLQILVLFLFYLCTYTLHKYHKRCQLQNRMFQTSTKMQTQLNNIKQSIAQTYCIYKHCLMVQNEICFGTNVKIMINFLAFQNKERKKKNQQNFDFFKKLSNSVLKQAAEQCCQLIKIGDITKKLYQQIVQAANSCNDEQALSNYQQILQIAYSVQLKKQMLEFHQKSQKLKQAFNKQKSQLQWMQIMQAGYEYVVRNIQLIRSLIKQKNQQQQQQNSVQKDFNLDKYLCFKQKSSYISNSKQFVAKLKQFLYLREINEQNRKNYHLLYEVCLLTIQKMKDQVKGCEDKVELPQNDLNQITVYKINDNQQNFSQQNISQNTKTEKKLQNQKQWIVTSESIKQVEPNNSFTQKAFISKKEKLQFMKQLNKMIISGKIKERQKLTDEKIKHMELQMQDQNTSSNIVLLK